MEFQLIHEAPEYVVAMKPAGMLVHPSKPGQGLTLWDHLRRALAMDLQSPDRQISLINRLDRETSGLVLVALSPEVASAFGLAMQNRLIHKEYLALVRGWPDCAQWVVQAPLDAQRRHQPAAVHLRQMVHPAGYLARTGFQVLEKFQRGGQSFALVRALPETGRMHQIRLHLAHSGHPVVGDKLYGPAPAEALYLEFIETGWTPRLAELLDGMRYHALHSTVLAWGDIPLHDPSDPEAEPRIIPAQRVEIPAPADWAAWRA